MRVELAPLLQGIERPQSGSGDVPKYHVKPVPGLERHYFGYTSSGTPCLLLSTNDTSLKAPIRLAAIEVSFAVPCRMSVDGADERTEILTAIACTANDRIVQGYFVHVCETILQIVGASPSLQQVVEAVRRLVDLFQRLTSPPRRSVVGLFGELFAIYSAHSPAAAVEAWRSTIDDRFDFSVGNVRLEVKASSTRQRSHEFSFEQCSPPPNTQGVLISIFVEASGGGMSMLDLIKLIEGQLSSDANLLLKLQETVAEGLGDSISTALSMRFDDSLAKSSLQVYELQCVPAIRAPLPYELSQVRFRSDLSRVPVADLNVLASQNISLRDLLPRPS